MKKYNKIPKSDILDYQQLILLYKVFIIKNLIRIIWRIK